MNLVLEPYQEIFKAHQLAHDRELGLVGVGLGKTATTLSSIHELALDGASKGTLIVAPLRVATLTWPNEIKKWDQFNWMRVESLRGQRPSGLANIYTINYEQLGSLGDLDFVDTVVFDEITRAKNPKSKRITDFRPLLKKHRRWGLTGTPRPNSLLELFAQVRLLDDGRRLGPSFHAFQQAWFEPTDFHKYNWVPKAGAAEKIYQRIADLALTLRSSDYLNIPETVVEDIEVTLPVAAQGIYKTLERDLLVWLNRHQNGVASGDLVLAKNAAVLVNKLLQVTGGTIYGELGADGQTPIHEIHTAKMRALATLLSTELKGERVLIATNYVHERERIVREIPGAVDASKFKGDIEDAWNSGRIQYLVADPRSLGHGLNLQQGGSTVVWFSLNWSRELYDQFNGRVARKGQGFITKIYRILAPGTMDDVVAETLRERGDAQTEMMTLLTLWRQQGLVFL